jgi:3-deoxy-D-manno-octulosonic-acid transferase
MKFLYDIFMRISEKILFLFGNFFGPKIRAFTQGRKNTFKQLEKCLPKNKKIIWFHVSSLGEYEQALPLIEKIKKQYPSYSLLLSFFSPSGYEIKKNKTPADCVVYLPLDHSKNVNLFLDKVRPSAVFFVKYDFWPGYLYELKKRNIPTYLVSGRFRKNHSFFKKRNKWLKNSLKAFHHFFVQDDESRQVMKQHGFENVTVTGDTRFDRVFDIAKKTEKPAFVKQFKQDKELFIAGSTWPEDEKLISHYLHTDKPKFKILIAPHQVNPAHIEEIEKKLKNHKTIRYSQVIAGKNPSQYDILILDTIGVLNKTYYYADWVYIGNGFGKSIHNIQEPAVYGVPIITGPNIEKFTEAVDLEKAGGLIKIHNQQEWNEAMDLLKNNPEIRKEKGQIVYQYAMANRGATDKILSQIQL